MLLRSCNCYERFLAVSHGVVFCAKRSYCFLENCLWRGLCRWLGLLYTDIWWRYCDVSFSLWFFTSLSVSFWVILGGANLLLVSNDTFWQELCFCIFRVSVCHIWPVRTFAWPFLHLIFPSDFSNISFSLISCFSLFSSCSVLISFLASLFLRCWYMVEFHVNILLKLTKSLRQAGF